MTERVLQAVCGLFIAVTVAVLVWLSDTGSTDLFSLFLFAWTSLPYLLLALVPRFARRLRSGASAAPALIGSFAVFGFAAYVVFEAFFADPDPQGAIAVLFVPVLQLPAVAAIFVVTLLDARRRSAVSAPS